LSLNLTDTASDASEDSFIDAAPYSELEGLEDDDSWLVLKQQQLSADVAAREDTTSNAAIPGATAVQPSLPLLPSVSLTLVAPSTSSMAKPKSYASVCADDWVSGPPAEPAVSTERKDQGERKESQSISLVTSFSTMPSNSEHRIASFINTDVDTDSKEPIAIAAATAVDTVDIGRPLPQLPHRPRPRRSRRQQKAAAVAARRGFPEGPGASDVDFSSVLASAQCGAAGGSAANASARPYATEIQHLELMGFNLSEHPFILDLLHATQGDVQKTLDVLLHS